MNKFGKIVLMVVALLFVSVAPAMAQPDAAPGEKAVVAKTDNALFNLRPIGVGLVVVGAAFGIGKLAASAYDGMSRQPEVAPKIQTAMIIAAALIEGFTFYALVLCGGQ